MNKIALTLYIAMCMTLGAVSGGCSQKMHQAEGSPNHSPGNTTYYIDPANGSDFLKQPPPFKMTTPHASLRTNLDDTI